MALHTLQGTTALLLCPFVTGCHKGNAAAAHVRSLAAYSKGQFSILLWMGMFIGKGWSEQPHKLHCRCNPTSGILSHRCCD